MEGKAEQAESLLKRAVAHGGHAPRVEQNLALALSLQGKFEEAKLLGAQKAAVEAVAAMVDYGKRMVHLEPKPSAAVLKAHDSSDAAGPERARGTGADAAATSDWVTHVAQLKPDA